MATMTENDIGAGPDSGGVRMTKSAVAALRNLQRPEAESVAKAIAAIGQVEGKPVVSGENGTQYFAIVPDDSRAHVVMYRKAPDGYLVTSLADRDAYQTFETAERPGLFPPGFLQSGTFKTAVEAIAATLGIILGARSGRT
jgi:hypothetical protein